MNFESKKFSQSIAPDTYIKLLSPQTPASQDDKRCSAPFRAWSVASYHLCTGLRMWNYIKKKSIFLQ